MEGNPPKDGKKTILQKNARHDQGKGRDEVETTIRSPPLKIKSGYPFCHCILPDSRVTKTTVMNTSANPSLWRYFILCLTKKYADFSGSATRREFWGFNLFHFIFSLIFILGLGGVAMVSLPWNELTAANDLTALQTLIYYRLPSLIMIEQVIEIALYLPIWSVIIRRLRDAGFQTAWGYGYIALSVFGLLKWAILDRFQYSDNSLTQLLGIVLSVYWLLLTVLACFPSRTAAQSTPES